jgi:hypothetical protein
MMRIREAPTSDMEEGKPSLGGAAPEDIPTIHLGDNLLPVDVWAFVVQNLAYHDVMQVAAVNSLFIKNVLPLLQTLYIFKLKDLSEPQARRFAHGNIDCVRIGILDQMSGSDDVDTNVNRIVTFLGYLPKLSQVHYGQICYNYGRLDREIFVPWNGKRNLKHSQNHYLRKINMCQMRGSPDSRMQKAADVHHQLVQAIERAMQQGSIPAHVKFQGLFPTQQNEALCDVCTRARSVLFPVESA